MGRQTSVGGRTGWEGYRRECELSAFPPDKPGHRVVVDRPFSLCSTEAARDRRSLPNKPIRRSIRGIITPSSTTPLLLSLNPLLSGWASRWARACWRGTWGNRGTGVC